MPGGPYITPRALIYHPQAAHAVAAKEAWPLLGNDRAFAGIELTSVMQGAVTTKLVMRAAYQASTQTDAALRALVMPRPPFAGLDLETARIMGIVNVTPDSFSDGGLHAAPDQAIAHALALAEAGADILDVGGESTRPDAKPVAPDEEQRRVLPVIRALANRDLRVSIDTRHAMTMGAAIAAGATIVNDVTALRDPLAMNAVARSNVAVILMHMQGEPRTMQKDPRYIWAPGDVFDVLASRVDACVAAGISRERIAVDPGIGFGKTAQHSAQILDHVGLFHALGCAIVIGVSRKRFIAGLSQGESVDQRLSGSLAAALHAVGAGVQIVRVHDVRETRQALAVAQNVRSA